MQSDNENKNEYTGKIAKALAGEVELDAVEAFKQANELTKGNFSTFILSGFIVAATVIVTIFMLLQILGVPIEQYNDMNATQSAIVDVTLVLLISPLMAGLMMMGVKSARQKNVKVGDLFNWVSITVVLALGSLIASILVQIGMMLFIIPGIYFGIATTFTLPLIADKKLTAISALILSVRVTTKYFLQIFIFFIISIVLFMFAAFTFGIALIWVLPLYFNAKGILYDKLFGDEQGVDASTSNASVFDA
ncbi:stress protein [Alteromonas facilis]|uniref:stress protein n=1 Tax=Alteromonas facilis TaxID=2048004 RepID=UPI000C28E472|nr:stress protein [Alteromonas facilis]